jgi:hypothetical protein
VEMSTTWMLEAGRVLLEVGDSEKSGKLTRE